MVYTGNHFSYEKALVELELKKNLIHKLSLFLEELIEVINTINQKITQTEFDIISELQALCKERDVLNTRTDVTHTQVALALAGLEKTLTDKKNMHNATMSDLEGQILELQKEYFTKCKWMESTLEAIKTQHTSVIQKLKKKMLGASIKEVKEMRQKTTQLEIVFDKDLDYLKRLQQQFCKNINLENKGTLDNPNTCITPSGNFLTSSARRLSWSEVSCIHMKQSQVLDDSISNTSESSSSFSSEWKMTSEDMQYLKTIFEKFLSEALTETIAKQPKDLIHDPAHWLFKYRYHQEVYMIKKQELEEFTNEKERLQQEKLDVLLLTEARHVLMDLILQAKEEAMRIQLDRIARDTEI